jgi:hypothetical protein
MGNQRDSIRLSLESPVDDPLQTFDRFNKQFQLKEPEREAVAWTWPQETDGTMFSIINAYKRATQFNGLPAESCYKLQRVGGNVLEMLN